MQDSFSELARRLHETTLRYELQPSLNFCANEALLSAGARHFLSSTLADVHQEGTAGTRRWTHQTARTAGFTFRGLPDLYALEAAILERFNPLIGAAQTDVRLSSGMHAMIVTLLCATEPGDLVLSIRPDDGGHFATASILARAGRRHDYLVWNNDRLDLELAGLARSAGSVSAIYLDQGAPLYPLDLGRLRACVGPQAVIVYDASHTLGLIAGGCFQSPLREGADILQGNTHKTFPGPQKAIVSFGDPDYAQAMSDSMSAGFVSSQHTHHVLALFMAMLETLEHGAAFARRSIENAQHLSDRLDSLGFTLVRRGMDPTQTNQLLIAFESFEEVEAFAERLGTIHIHANAKKAYGRNVLRLGTQHVTRRGMAGAELDIVAQLFRDAYDGVSLSRLGAIARDLDSTFRSIAFSFDPLG